MSKPCKSSSFNLLYYRFLRSKFFSCLLVSDFFPLLLLPRILLNHAILIHVETFRRNKSFFRGIHGLRIQTVPLMSPYSFGKQTSKRSVLHMKTTSSLRSSKTLDIIAVRLLYDTDSKFPAGLSIRGEVTICPRPGTGPRTTLSIARSSGEEQHRTAQL